MLVNVRHCFICIAALLVSATLASRVEGDGSVSGRGQNTSPDVTGRVVDTEGRPIPGVKIWTWQTEEDRRQGREPQPLAITGPDGTFVAHGVQPFSRVAVCPMGWVYEKKQLMGRPPFPPIELRLRKATRISGRVVDKSGEPVAGVTVWARLEGSDGGCIRQGALPPCENSYEPRSGITDAEGRFVFESLEPGWFEISVAEPEEGEHQIVRRQGAAGRGIEGVEFVLARKSVPVEGRVFDADGAPVIGAQVTLSRALPSRVTTTDTSGNFNFSGVLSGENHLEVSHEEQGWIEKDLEIEDRPVLLDLQMPRRTLVQGRVLGPGGIPVKKVYLNVGERYIDVAADGSFRFTAPPGEHEILGDSFEPKATTRERFLARGKPVDLELRLVRPGTIKVRLMGLPPEEEGNVDLKNRPEGLTFGLDNGLHTLDGVPPGTWTLVASDANGRAFERRGEVREGEVTDVGEIHFPPLPTVRGRVLDPAGRPSAGAWVAFGQDDREIRAQTGADGTFSIWLREGTWLIRAEQEGFGPATAAVEPSGDEPVELQDLQLARLITVSGRVLGVAPEVVVARLQAKSEDGLGSIVIPVDRDNRFSSSNLWPGTWTLSTDVDGRPVSTTLRILPGTVEAQVDLDCHPFPQP